MSDLVEIATDAMMGEMSSWCEGSGPPGSGSLAACDARILARAALAALREAGFAVVPREATDAMKVAGGLALEKTMFETGVPLIFDVAAACHDAMVAAAEGGGE